MKLVYCVGALDKPGGTEKVLVNKCNYFVNHFDYEVHIITVNQLDKSYCYDWDEKIVFHDIEYTSSSSKLLNVLSVPKNISWFRNVYRNLLDKIAPDIIVVSERGYLDYIIPFICKKIPKIREFHTSKKAINIHANQMSYSKKWQHKTMYSLLYRMFNKYDHIVLLTDSDAKESSYKVPVSIIPNMIAKVNIEKAKLDTQKVISVGSMNGRIKDFDSQIIMWKDIAKQYPDWTLNIYGDGRRRSYLQNLINSQGLSKQVLLHGVNTKITDKYLDASFSLFTSVGEGFGMVLIESMSLGVPCISFSCPHGPSEIIKDEEDGFLVEPNEFEEFKDKIRLLIEKIELRKRLGQQARKNVTRFYPAEVSLKWKSLFDKITSN